MTKNKKISVLGTEITISKQEETEYISLTDIARHKDGANTDAIIQNWLRNRNTIELLGFWETMYNSNFKPLEFEGFRKQAGLNSFVLTPKKWIETTNAIGIVSKSGRYGGTFAHKDIAFRLNLEWNLQRTLAKVNYKIHTDAIKESLIPKSLSPKQVSFIYANEADVLNMALFGKTAQQWRDENPNEKGNVRDMATIQQLVVLSNLESINALLINQEINQQIRLEQLNEIAISQMKSLVANNTLKNFK